MNRARLPYDSSPHRRNSLGRPVNLALAVSIAMSAVACGHRDSLPPEDPREPIPPVTTEASMSTPDFRAFVVGDMAGPSTSTRDPFLARQDRVRTNQSSVAKPRRPAPPNLVLRGIVESNGQWIALLAQGSVSVGDRVGPWTVATIDKHSVLLRQGSAEKRLRM